MTALSELLVDLALLGVMFVGLMAVVYGFVCGWLFARPTKMQRQILYRALAAHPRSQDPIVERQERKLLKALEVVE